MEKGVPQYLLQAVKLEPHRNTLGTLSRYTSASRHGETLNLPFALLLGAQIGTAIRYSCRTLNLAGTEVGKQLYVLRKFRSSCSSS